LVEHALTAHAGVWLRMPGLAAHASGWPPMSVAGCRSGAALALQGLPIPSANNRTTAKGLPMTDKNGKKIFYLGNFSRKYEELVPYLEVNIFSPFL